MNNSRFNPRVCTLIFLLLGIGDLEVGAFVPSRIADRWNLVKAAARSMFSSGSGLHQRTSGTYFCSIFLEISYVTSIEIMFGIEESWSA